MKRGVGRGAGANGNGRAVFPPVSTPVVTRYQQPPPPGVSGFGILRRVLVGVLVVLSSLGLGIGGGAYLWFHQSISAVQSHADLKKVQKELDIALPGHPSIALVIGYDHRRGIEGAGPSRSDTVMLIRADPIQKTLSLLSFPRDLLVPIYCGSTPMRTDRINSAYSSCGARGTVDTVRHLTGLPVNYVITVDFHGFKKVVNSLGGVWLDIDRRYYNKNIAGVTSTDFANINIQPGYQRLTGGAALEFVRYRHTDSDLYRLARQQEFVRAMKQQATKNLSLTNITGIVNDIVDNIEVAAGGHKLNGHDVINWAFFAKGLPGGHVFQPRIQDVTGYAELTAAQQSVQQAVNEFENPDVQSSKAANAAALGKKLKTKTPPPSSVTLTVVNGNGIAGAAANASFLFGQRGYKTVPPPNNLEPNIPQGMQSFFHSKIYYDPAQPGSKEAATALQNLMQPADVVKMRRTPWLLSLDPGSMLMVVLGTTFHGDIAQPTVTATPKHEPPNTRVDPSTSLPLLEQVKSKVTFPLELPTVLERSSYADSFNGDTAVRAYAIEGKHKAVRLTYRTGATEYWGIEETDWSDAPVLADRSFRHDLGGREFDLYYAGPHLHMVVLRANGATYWVVNTLLDSLSNETMLAIAKGLKPLTSIH
ncbi:MAG TPA: LCP family protein [Gaiellaceae bacterium]|nr:LCP family protein [Gaiellaceae bacterium]